MKTVIITNGSKSYSEVIDNSLLENYCELVGNGSNEHMLNISFNHWTRPIKDNVLDLDKYNTKDINSHFIFGWMECFSQSDDIPNWVRDSIELIIEVKETDS